MLLEHGKKIKVDNKDKLILEQLQLNARLTIAEIAKITKLPRDVVMYRIKKMETSKVIRGHHTMINPGKIGHPLYSYVFFSTYNLKVETENAFIKYLTSQKHIVYVAKNSGQYDFTIGICAKDYREFDEIIRSIRQKFINVIKDITVTPVIQEYKFDMMTDLI
jgi:DNA-binding Lrp family transcriptional regulator|tara:strand:- start:307 stop:795 length:489 start_codon:yes stop_codon:yes gene_type:complete